MAKIIENEKGFKVIEISRSELIDKLGKYGAKGICDSCAKTAVNGFYVAVLNSWCCPECYKNWLERAKYYKEDAAFETRIFELYKQIFGINENREQR